MHALEIRIQRQVGTGWPVVVEQHATQDFLPVRDEGILRLDLDTLRQQLTPRDYGTYLGQALFCDEVRDAFVSAYSRSAETLRCLLCIEASELKTLRWERLCVPLDGQWDFLALSQRVPFSFYVPSLTDRRFPPLGRRDLRALVLVANPDNLDTYQLAPFDASATVASVCAALGELPYTVLATVEGAAGPPTLDALCERLTAEPYTLLHVVCHGQFRRGDGETVLYLATADNRVEPVLAGRLIERLGQLQGVRGLPHLAFLSTCDSAVAAAEGALGSLAQRLVRDLGMPAVVAMTECVSIQTAQALAEAFYRHVRRHGEVDRGLAEACAGLAARYDMTVPALYSRLGGRPLFSDALDRPLTWRDIDFGLTQMEALLPEHAPVLLPTCHAITAPLKAMAGTDVSGLSAVARQAHDRALSEVNTLCEEALDLSFHALALGQEPPPYDTRCPFRGLYPFRASDQGFFFGREALVAQLQQRLAEHPFLAVLGPSGSGKSSLVLAGLIPALQAKEPGLHLAYMTPGSDPPAALDSALAGVHNRRAVLVVDQGEELFTLCAEADTRQAFVERLLHLPRQMRVVLTMRADFWGECAPYPALKEAMQASQELVAPMLPDELRRAIEQQAAHVGLRFEADLSQEILDDSHREPGAMPLLQHALLELWKRRHGRWLRAQEYRALGGVQQAIAHTADEVYAQLPAADQTRMRDIFMRLTRLDYDTLASGGGRDTRQRVGLLELLPAGSDTGATRALLGRLADARLVVTSVNSVTGREDVEVAHEALIRSWPRLRTWLAEDRVELQLRAGIREAALEWEAHQRDEQCLVHRGSRLQDAVALSSHPRFAFNALEQAYVDACVALQEQERAAREAQRQRELDAAHRLADEQHQRAEVQSRAARRLRALTLVLTIVFLGVVGAAVYAGRQQHLAQTRQQISLAQALAAQAAREQEQPLYSERGALLARQAYLFDQRHQGPVLGQVDDALRKTLGAPYFSHVLRGHTDAVWAVAFSPDSQTLVSGSVDKTVRLWGLRQPAAAPTVLSSQAERVYAVAVSPDGRSLAAGSADGTVRLWAVGAPHASLLTLRGHEHEVYAVAFSPDGHTLASGSIDGTVRLWPLGGRSSVPTVLIGHSGGVLAVAFSPDSQTLASGSADGTIRLWERHGAPATARVLHGHRDLIRAVAFSPDGRTLASGSADSTIYLWSVNTPGVAFTSLRGHESTVVTVAFSPDGTTLASGSDDRSIRLWPVQTPTAPSTVLRGHKGSVLAVAFSPDGTTLASASDDRSIRLWDRDQPAVVPGVFHGHAQPVTSVALSPDSQTLASGSLDGTIRLWQAGAPEAPPQVLHGHADEVNAVAFSPDGRTLASGSLDQTVRLWTPGQPAAAPTVLQGHQGGVLAVAFSPDGRRLASGSEDQTIRLWNTSRPDAVAAVLQGHTDWVRTVAFSRDGRTLASGSYDTTIRLWDLDKPQHPALVLPGHTEAVQTVASARMAAPSLPAVVIKPSGCGTWPVPHPRPRPCTVLRNGSGRWLSARTARRWRLVAPTKPCGSGLQATAAPSRLS